MSEQNKADIVTVGVVDDDGQPQGWVFDCSRCDVPMINVTKSGVLWGGYSLDELREIARQNGESEWVN
jgi:hypothetical protein